MHENRIGTLFLSFDQDSKLLERHHSMQPPQTKAGTPNSQLRRTFSKILEIIPSFITVGGDLIP